MNKKLLIFAAGLMMVFGPSLKGQTTPETHLFTLSWQANTAIDSTFSVHSLLTFDGQAAPSSVCGQSVQGYDIWCGEVLHYGGGFDFNFQDVLLSECGEVGTPQTTIVYTSSTRRTSTDYRTFACTDRNVNKYQVNTVVLTNEYKATQRYVSHWYPLPQGQQVPIQGTLTKE